MSDERWKVLITLFLGSFLMACSSFPKSPQIGCQSGEECNFEGVIDFHQGEPAWAVVVRDQKKCAKLAVPEEFLIEQRLWQGKHVFVSGMAFGPYTEDDSGAMWIGVRGRKIAMGICDQGPVIFVHTVRSRQMSRSFPDP